MDIHIDIQLIIILQALGTSWQCLSEIGTFFLKPFKCFPFNEKDSERACKGIEEEDGDGFDTAVLPFLAIDLVFDDRPISNSLDLTSTSLSSTVVISK